jgi:hypothetical protein
VARFVKVHASSDVVGGLEVEMVFEFAASFAVPLVAAEKSTPLHVNLLFNRPQHLVDGVYEAIPSVRFQAKLFFSNCSEAIEARLPVVLRSAPFGSYRAAKFQAVESRVERAVFHLKDIVGPALDRVGDGVTMGGSGEESLKNEKVKSTLEHLAIKRAHAPIDGRPEKRLANPPAWKTETRFSE